MRPLRQPEVPLFIGNRFKKAGPFQNVQKLAVCWFRQSDLLAVLHGERMGRGQQLQTASIHVEIAVHINANNVVR